MRPICVPCGREMTCVLNGVFVGYRDAQGRPDAVRAGDLYECPACHRRAVYGLSQAAKYAGDRGFEWEYGASSVTVGPTP